jgi:hypothetical protein
MVYPILSGIIILVALIAVLAAGSLLLKRHWFMGWLRGMIGLLLFSAAIILGLAALDLYSYKQLSKEQSIANLGFTKLDNQLFQVALVDSSGIEQTHQLNGDLWQLDARILKWNKPLAMLGLATGYRLDQLSGRYYSLEKEQTEPRTVYQLGNSKSLLDIWNWLHQYGSQWSFVEATYGSATYMPMEDGALYSVSLSATGLLARPLNERARAATANWE